MTKNENPNFLYAKVSDSIAHIYTFNTIDLHLNNSITHFMDSSLETT